MDGSDHSLSTDTAGVNINCLQTFDSNLYAGEQNGIIYELDKTTGLWTTNTDLGTGIIPDFKVYGGKLYAVLKSSGKVYVSSAPVASDSWSLSCDTTSTNAPRMTEYNGSLYMIGSDESTFTRIYAFDGTSWTTSTDISTGNTLMAIAVHRGKLYALAGAVLHEFDGTKWTQLGTAITGAELISFKGNLLILQTGSGDVYWWDFASAADVNLYSSLNLTTSTMMKIYQGTLFIAHTDAQLKIYTPIKEILISMQNQNSVNPL